jgi:hypothetical protein
MPPPRLPMIFSTCPDRLFVEFLNCSPIRTSKRDMGSGDSGSFFRKYPKRDVQTIWSKSDAMTMEFFLFAIPERCERGCVPGGDLFKPGWRDGDTDVIEHDDSDKQKCS